MIPEISADAFVRKIRSGENAGILDVRTGIECRAEKLGCNFTHIPLHELDAATFAASETGKALAGRPLYIICRSGGRARKAAEALQKTGLKPVVVEGGISACAACAAPIARGKVISLERQVRIAAGALVLTGVLLGHFATSGFYALSGMIGAGLVFAGITDKCGMALLLARAPWNRDRTKDAIQESLGKFQEKESRT